MVAELIGAMANILVIEDNETMLEGISRTLERMGHRVVGVPDGQQGLEVCRKGDIDLVIADYKMQPMDGMEVLERVKRMDEDIDVVIITAYGTIELAVEAMKKGAYDYVPKPFNTGELQITVRKALDARNLRRVHRHPLRLPVLVRILFPRRNLARLGR